MTREAFQGLSLVVCQIRERVLDFLEFLDIGEKTVRRDKILVHIVEIAKDHIAPEDELVKRLGTLVQGLVAVVQFEEKGHSVARPCAGDFIEEIIDSQHLRSLDRLA